MEFLHVTKVFFFWFFFFQLFKNVKPFLAHGSYKNGQWVGDISNERWERTHLNYVSVIENVACFFNQIPPKRSSQEPLQLWSFCIFPSCCRLFWKQSSRSPDDTRTPATSMHPDLWNFSQEPDCFPFLPASVFPVPSSASVCPPTPARVHSPHCSGHEYKSPWPAPGLDRAGSRESLAQVHAMCDTQNLAHSLLRGWNKSDNSQPKWRVRAPQTSFCSVFLFHSFVYSVLGSTWRLDSSRKALGFYPWG